METASIIKELGDFCRETGLAESTFGRLAVNDGKLISRLRDGRRITNATLARVRRFMAENRESPRPRRGRRLAALAYVNGREHPVAAKQLASPRSGDTFRAADTRQRYLHFVQTCGEQAAIATRIAQELPHLEPHPPAVRIYDARLGDGTVFARTLRALHGRFPQMPVYAVGREADSQNLRLALDKLADRLAEHPGTVAVLTNLNHAAAPWLASGATAGAAGVLWQEVALSGSSADAFERQIADLASLLADHWRSAPVNAASPGLDRPVVIVLYRADQRFGLDAIIPRPGSGSADFDLVVAAHPYRSRASADNKVRRVLAPLVSSLGRGGRLLGFHAIGQDSAIEIVHSLWPGDDPFPADRYDLLRALKAALGPEARDYGFHVGADARSTFRYPFDLALGEVDGPIAGATLISAWNAATYVAEIEDRRLMAAARDDRHLTTTEAVLRKHHGLWFRDESYVITRRRG